MGKPIRELIRRTFFSKKGNLINLDSPFPIMGKLLGHKTINGILDAGASDGRISKRLIRLFPSATAYLFEPNPAYQQPLEDLAKADERYKPFAYALSDQQGELTYYETESLGCCSLLKPMDRHTTKVSSVSAVTIDAWSRSQGNPPIELLKFDIQGGELSALKGGRTVLEESALMVYCEVWFNCLYAEGPVFSEIDLLLREHGFELYNLYSPKSDHNDMLIWANAIYWHRGKLGISPQNEP